MSARAVRTLLVTGQIDAEDGLRLLNGVRRR
jgi:hypothetical protein